MLVTVRDHAAADRQTLDQRCLECDEPGCAGSCRALAAQTSAPLGEAALSQALARWRLSAPARVTPLAGGCAAQTWLVETPDQRYVARYAFVAQETFDSGLRAAEALAAQAIACAAPLRTRDGALSLLVAGAHGRAEPLAVLRYLPGEPLDRHSPTAPARVGALLARIHRVWRHATDLPRPPDRIVRALAEPTPELGAQPGLAALIERALAQARAFERSTHVCYGPIIGERIELLDDPAGAGLGLADAGALGWGPLLLDLAIALDQIPESPQAGALREQLVQAYRAVAPLRPSELAGLRHYAALQWALIARRLAKRAALGDAEPAGDALSLAAACAALERALDAPPDASRGCG